MTTRMIVKDYDDVITFGKYRGKTIGDIADINPRYIIWLNEEKIVEFPEDILEAAIIDDANNSPPESYFWESD
jgi:uncharacterized protein (DUF3820 family)